MSVWSSSNYDERVNMEGRRVEIDGLFYLLAKKRNSYWSTVKDPAIYLENVYVNIYNLIIIKYLNII